MLPNQRVTYAWLYSVIALVLTMTPSIALAQRSSVSLNDNWEFRQQLESPADQQVGWHPAQVPGVVHTDLLRNKLIPDPFYRSNEGALQWIENSDWEYRSTFQATPEVLKRRHIELVFQGLDGPAEVSLNGKQILNTNNTFREWRVDVKGLL